MKADRYIISSHDELVALFNRSQSSRDMYKEDYAKSRYGTSKDLSDMPEYYLEYFPYNELVFEPVVASFSLKRSIATGRLYVWNVNLGGHAPKLELRPVTLEHVMNIPLMKKYHENMAYELGRNITHDATYEI